MDDFLCFSGDLRGYLLGDIFEVGGTCEGLIGISSITPREFAAADKFQLRMAWGIGRGVGGNSRKAFLPRTEPIGLRIDDSNSCC